MVNNRTTNQGSHSGTQTDTLVSGGYLSGSYTGKTEKFDGTSWTETGDLGTARTFSGASVKGSTTASLVAGGENPVVANTEQFNGASWTEVNNLNQSRWGLAGSGTEAAALVWAGYVPGPTTVSLTETWNGGAWTEVNNTNSAGYGSGNIGTQTAALCTGRAPNPVKDKIEEWNGTSWTEVAENNSARFGVAGFGLSTLAGIGGGNQNPPSASALTEIWNGSSWTEVSDMVTGATRYNSGAGSSSAGISTVNDDTEFWDVIQLSNKTITAS